MFIVRLFSAVKHADVEIAFDSCLVMSFGSDAKCCITYSKICQNSAVLCAAVNRRQRCKSHVILMHFLPGLVLRHRL